MCVLFWNIQLPVGATRNKKPPHQRSEFIPRRFSDWLFRILTHSLVKNLKLYENLTLNCNLVYLINLPVRWFKGTWEGCHLHPKLFEVFLGNPHVNMHSRHWSALTVTVHNSTTDWSHSSNLPSVASGRLTQQLIPLSAHWATRWVEGGCLHILRQLVCTA